MIRWEPSIQFILPASPKSTSWERSARSVLAQAYHDASPLIVGSGLVDDPPDVSRISILHVNYRGGPEDPIGEINSALTHASGELIGILVPGWELDPGFSDNFLRACNFDGNRYPRQPEFIVGLALEGDDLAGVIFHRCLVGPHGLLSRHVDDPVLEWVERICHHVQDRVIAGKSTVARKFAERDDAELRGLRTAERQSGATVPPPRGRVWRPLATYRG